MALPKAVLCVLDESPSTSATPGATGGMTEEAMLRASGFATASILWSEVVAQRGGWMQLLPVLDDQAVHAWVFAGHAESYTQEIVSQISMLTLAMRRPAPPMTALVLTGGGTEPEIPEWLEYIRIFHGNTSFAAKLAATRMKPRAALSLPFHVEAHLDPLIGQWLEVGPTEGETWNSFMAGVIGAEVTAFGVGPRGTLPHTSTLHYPQCGIQGDWGGRSFSACAAKNDIGMDTACFMRIEGSPQAVFVTDYPEEGSPNREQWVDWLEL